MGRASLARNARGGERLRAEQRGCDVLARIGTAFLWWTAPLTKCTRRAHQAECASAAEHRIGRVRDVELEDVASTESWLGRPAQEVGFCLYLGGAPKPRFCER